MLFAAGEARYEAGEYLEAARILGRVPQEFPDSRWVAPAYLVLGSTQLHLKHPKDAVNWFEDYLREYPRGTQCKYAYRGLSDAQAALGDWAASEAAAIALLALPDLSPGDEDSAQARQARARVEQGNLGEKTQILLEDAVLRHGPAAHLEDGFPDDTDTGPMARFYLGELARLRAEAIALTTAVDLEKVASELDMKADFVLEAHRHYYRTFSYGDNVWNARAAYQMANIYERFYLDVMEAPAPEGLSLEDQELYSEALDEALINVVKRAYVLYGQVVRYARDFSLEEEWVERCRQGIVRLEQRIQSVEGRMNQSSDGEDEPEYRKPSQPAGQSPAVVSPPKGSI